MHIYYYTMYYAYMAFFNPLLLRKSLRYKGLRGYGRIGYERFITYPREVRVNVSNKTVEQRGQFFDEVGVGDDTDEFSFIITRVWSYKGALCLQPVGKDAPKFYSSVGVTQS